MKKISLIIGLFLVGITTNAQWTNNTDVNTEVSTYESENQDLKSVSLSDGRTAIVFWKEVSTGGNYELWLQIMDVDGNKEFGAEGMLINNTIPMSTYVNYWSLTTDANDNIYVGITGSADSSAWVIALDNQGNSIWSSNGVSVGSGYLVKVLPLSDGNLLVSWIDNSAYQALFQKYDVNGNAVWTQSKPMSTSGYTAPAFLFELSTGEIISIYHFLLGSGVNSVLYAQKFTASGDIIWSNPVQLSTTTTTYNKDYSTIQIGDNVYIGYVGKHNSRFNSYIQRLNPDGSLPWGVNGLDFDVNQTNYEMDTRIAVENGSNDLWAICTYTNSNQSEHGEFIQKINTINGSRLFTDNAKELFAIGSENTHVGELYVYNDKAMFLIEKGYNDGVSDITLDIVSIDSNGDFTWASQTNPIASNPGTNKGEAQLNRKINGQSTVVFTENKNASVNGEKIYIQNFTEGATGIDDLDKIFNNDLFYENPVKNVLKVKSQNNIETIKIVDALGRSIFTENYINNNVINLNVSDWNKGLYIMIINSNKSYKLIKD